MDMIRKSQLFRSLDDEQFEHIRPRLKHIALNACEVLYSEGSPADTVAIVLAGSLAAIKMSVHGGGETILSEFGPSDVIGEMALLSDRNRSASIRAIEKSELAILPRAFFGALERQRPDIALAIMKGLGRILAQRLQDTSSELADERA
jgi:CRP-like cAMP-binding protein